MRTSFRTIAIASSCGILSIASLPSATAGDGVDRVVGGGQNNPPASSTKIAHFQINASSGPNGENAQGSFSFKRTADGPPSEQFTAAVTCVNVAGNLATVIGAVVRTKDVPAADGQYYLLNIKDLGQGGDSLDEVQSQRYFGDPFVCPPPGEPKPGPITSGNVNVFDAS